MSPVSFLELPDGRRLAYYMSEGRLPCVIFMGGFKSDMTGAKAMALEAFCQSRGQRFIRFDYTGHGQSSGQFRDGTIGSWKQDALDILDHLGSGDNVLVGSSMGAWIALLVALERKNKITGMVGVASAPDFTEDLIWNRITEGQKEEILKNGLMFAPSCYGEEPYPITHRLIEEGRDHLLLKNSIDLTIPIRLLHGMNDEDVPWERSIRLMDCLRSADVNVTFIKGGNHRLSEPTHLALMCQTLEGLLLQLQ